MGEGQQVGQRLSTILEVSCESESPLKKAQKQQQKQQQAARGAERRPTVLDVDSIPIGGKATNRMSFEQLLEESLRRQEQLDKDKDMDKDMEKEQRGGTVRHRPLAKKPFLLKSGAKAAPPTAKQAEPEAADADARAAGPPRPFLKRGEGLRRFQPKASKNQQHQSQHNSQHQLQRNGGSTAALCQQLAQQQELTQRKIVKKCPSTSSMGQQQPRPPPATSAHPSARGNTGRAPSGSRNARRARHGHSAWQ